VQPHCCGASCVSWKRSRNAGSERCCVAQPGANLRCLPSRGYTKGKGPPLHRRPADRGRGREALLHLSLKRARIKKFPVLFPVSRDFGRETGSRSTAFTTTHSGGCFRQQKGTHDDGRRTLRRSRASQLQRRPPPTVCNPSRAPRR
jgi:hypothetical protein